MISESEVANRVVGEAASPEVIERPPTGRGVHQCVVELSLCPVECFQHLWLLRASLAAALPSRRQFQSGSPGQQFQRFAEPDPGFFHHKAEAVPSRLTNPAAIALAIGIDVQRGVMVVVKRAQANVLPPPMKASQPHRFADQFDEVGPRPYELLEFARLIQSLDSERFPLRTRPRGTLPEASAIRWESTTTGPSHCCTGQVAALAVSHSSVRFPLARSRNRQTGTATNLAC